MNINRVREYLAFNIIGTSAEPPLRWLLSLRELRDRRKHPEWNSVRDEGRGIERLIPDVLPPTSNCIDVGCHLGSVLSLMQRYAPAGKHMCFEPTPYKANWLRRRYPSIQVRQEALSDRSGTAHFYYKVNQSGYSGLRSHGSADWRTETFSVDCVKLDDIIGDRVVNFIKMDVEGAEPLVLRGAERTLRRDKPYLLFECTQSGLELYNWTPDAVYELLNKEFGYKIYLIKDWLDRRPALPREGFVASMSYPAQAFNFFASTR